ncbi:hypothetical protein JY651_42695 [Pyxidicoccus parkwayensis]|uniref:Uncharacterized protein n=1 Tax=Pyxidicoccus parkwayensis TaxID=2813578 RepID=A0ABX7NTI4_9BACT|nr:hypothetical protein [Pyxidicoccus parkwaysis]QSQ21793.1 hypothetical protein JY651_42695 [Pyxidicoccus parkwaysis]
MAVRIHLTLDEDAVAHRMCVTTRFNSGPAAGPPGHPKDSGGNLIDFDDVATGDHPCGSHVIITH